MIRDSQTFYFMPQSQGTGIHASWDLENPQRDKEHGLGRKTCSAKMFQNNNW